MGTNEWSDRIEELVSRELGIPREEITRDSRFEDDLGIDEFDRLELVEAVELGWAIRLPSDAAKRIETVADLEILMVRSRARA